MGIDIIPIKDLQGLRDVIAVLVIFVLALGGLIKLITGIQAKAHDQASNEASKGFIIAIEVVQSQYSELRLQYSELRTEVKEEKIIAVTERKELKTEITEIGNKHTNEINEIRNKYSSEINDLRNHNNDAMMKVQAEISSKIDLMLALSTPGTGTANLNISSK